MVNGPNAIKDIIFSTVEKEGWRGEKRREKYARREIL